MQCRRYRTDENERKYGDDRAKRDGNIYEKGKKAVCLFFVILAEGFCHYGTAARAEHEAHRAEYHEKRIDEIDRRERCFADII